MATSNTCSEPVPASTSDSAVICSSAFGSACCNPPPQFCTRYTRAASQVRLQWPEPWNTYFTGSIASTSKPGHATPHTISPTRCRHSSACIARQRPARCSSCCWTHARRSHANTGSRTCLSASTGSDSSSHSSATTSRAWCFGTSQLALE